MPVTKVAPDRWLATMTAEYRGGRRVDEVYTQLFRSRAEAYKAMDRQNLINEHASACIAETRSWRLENIRRYLARRAARPALEVQLTFL